MADTPSALIEASNYPEPVQLTVRFDVFSTEKGMCAANFEIPEGSELERRYGGKGRALAACRDIIVETLDTLIERFHDLR